jgi:hypothetical protein
MLQSILVATIGGDADASAETGVEAPASPLRSASSPVLFGELSRLDLGERPAAIVLVTELSRL